jgi:ubiquitin-like modifier-activating enzyme ATG7
MPGHPATSPENTRKDVELLHSLVQEHDAVFLLTDSREARWLPTVMGAALDKVRQETNRAIHYQIVMVEF